MNERNTFAADYQNCVGSWLRIIPVAITYHADFAYVVYRYDVYIDMYVYTCIFCSWNNKIKKYHILTRIWQKVPYDSDNQNLATITSAKYYLFRAFPEIFIFNHTSQKRHIEPGLECEVNSDVYPDTWVSQK